MSESAVKNMQDRRQKVWNEAKVLADTAAEQNRNFDGEEERKWRELDAELDDLDNRIQDVLKGQQRAKDAADAVDRLAGKPVERADGSGVAGGGKTAEQEDKELRAWL